MPDLYDRLNEKLDADPSAGDRIPFEELNERIEAGDPPTGITTMDILELETDQRSVMLMVMRDPNKVDGVPRDAIEQRLLANVADLEATLRALIVRGWLIELGEAPALRYRANLRARRGASGIGLWAFLTDQVI
jgi:hypothetical protein